MLFKFKFKYFIFKSVLAILMHEVSRLDNLNVFSLQFKFNFINLKLQMHDWFWESHILFSCDPFWWSWQILLLYFQVIWIIYSSWTVLEYLMIIPIKLLKSKFQSLACHCISLLNLLTQHHILNISFVIAVFVYSSWHFYVVHAFPFT